MDKRVIEMLPEAVAFVTAFDLRGEIMHPRFNIQPGY
jgi:hypothetical protein